MLGISSRLLPWKPVLRRFARRHGFLDPIYFLARLRAFGQPSEVGEPIELLRSGALFHARGLVNSRAIQNNLDWIWPFWVQRQFDPSDISFLPRAFSFSHVNLTHRNWTAVGSPDHPVLPIIDPAGLVTPFLDGWSIDAWILGSEELIPSAAHALSQSLEMGRDTLAVLTSVQRNRCRLEMRAEVLPGGKTGRLCLRYRACAEAAGSALVVSIRPCNPEGVSFIDTLEWDDSRGNLRINQIDTVYFPVSPQRILFSNYRHGDVADRIRRDFQGDAPREKTEVRMHDPIGMATAGAIFPLPAGEKYSVAVEVDLSGDPKSAVPFGIRSGPRQNWTQALTGVPELRVPDAKFVFLYDAAVRSLLLHCQGSVTPGPFTYKRFWFRDAAFILNALLALGRFERVREVLDHYPEWQNRQGYFLSQNGEWDANGEALWILRRYLDQSGVATPEAWLPAIRKGAEWIRRKRRRASDPEELRGLFPAGMSAEHFGPNDFFYWDDFWGVAGLWAAAEMTEAAQSSEAAQAWRREGMDFLNAIEASINFSFPSGKAGQTISAAPHRRMDAAAIGVLVASYPLELWPERDARLLATAEFLHSQCSFRGGFFQEMVHSGVNAYLTLHLAQAFLRAGEAQRFQELLRVTANLASPTGQWPEAIHPHTRGGCMGDGQHVWASAEWVMAMRAAFLREEGNRLILGSGLFPDWLQGSPDLFFGNAPCRFGALRLSVTSPHGSLLFRWEADWRRIPEMLEIKVPGTKHITMFHPSANGEIKLQPG